MITGVKNYFYFTKNERNGVILLIVICAILLILTSMNTSALRLVKSEQDTKTDKSFNSYASQLKSNTKKYKSYENKFYQNQYNPDQKIDVNTASFKQLTSLGLHPKIAHTIINYRDKGGHFKNAEAFSKIYGISDADLKLLTDASVFSEENSKSTTLSPVEFDPNTATQETLVRMGLPKHIVQTMINFREKGGKFYAKEDLSKIYGMKEEWMKTLMPFVQLDETTKTGYPKTDRLRSMESPNKPAKALININTATELELTSIKGIGPAYAARIVKYRNLLGGFYSIEQVAETRNLPDSTAQMLKNFVIVDKSFQAIKINQVDRLTLLKHPYINGPQAVILINYRLQHGNFHQIADIEKTKAFSQTELNKLSGYLDFSE